MTASDTLEPGLPPVAGDQHRLPSRTARISTLAALVVAAALLGIAATQARAAAPSPPFHQCPAVNSDSSCAILLVVNPDGSVSILQDASQPPFDKPKGTAGAEDTLVGVQNNSGITVPSISVGSATQTLFGFDNEGLCTYPFTGNGYCTATPKPATGYEGPDSTFTAISVDKKRGTVNFTDPGGGLPAGASTYFSLEETLTQANFGTGAASSLTFGPTSATSSDFADAATMSATLTSGGAPVTGAVVTFTLDPGSSAVVCHGTTNASGVASCSLTPTQRAGAYQVVASYAGSSMPFVAPVNTTAPFTVTLEQDSLVYTGPRTATAGQPLVLSAAMTTDDPASGSPLNGRAVTLTLGTGPTAQSCPATTNAAGGASCTVVVSAQQPAATTVSASFVNDPFYEPATAGVTVTVAGGVPTPEVGAAGGVPAGPAAVLLVGGGCAVAAARRRGRSR